MRCAQCKTALITSCVAICIGFAWGDGALAAFGERIYMLRYGILVFACSFLLRRLMRPIWQKGTYYVVASTIGAATKGRWEHAFNEHLLVKRAGAVRTCKEYPIEISMIIAANIGLIIALLMWVNHKIPYLIPAALPYLEPIAKRVMYWGLDMAFHPLLMRFHFAIERLRRRIKILRAVTNPLRHWFNVRLRRAETGREHRAARRQQRKPPPEH